MPTKSFANHEPSTWSGTELSRRAQQNLSRSFWQVSAHNCTKTPPEDQLEPQYCHGVDAVSYDSQQLVSMDSNRLVLHLLPISQVTLFVSGLAVPP